MFIGKLLAGDFCLLMTIETEFAVTTVKQLLMHGGMGGMTGQATAFTGNRRMNDLYPHAGIFMARKAELVAIGNEQFFVCRGMGVMAGSAFPLLKRLMLYQSLAHQRGGIMTIKTELGAGRIGFKRFAAVRRLMASLTISPGNRFMLTDFEKFRLR